LRGDLDVRRAARGARRFVLPLVSPAREDALRDGQPECVLIERAEPHLREVDPRLCGTGLRLLQRGVALRLRGSGRDEWRTHRLRRGRGRAVRGASAGERRELRAQRASIRETGIDLRQVQAPRLQLLAVGTRDAGARNLQCLTLPRGQTNGLLERERASGTGPRRGRGRR